KYKIVIIKKIIRETIKVPLIILLNIKVIPSP
ncbi:unnamed protein product, partial [marine sediment metagenome]